MRVAVSMTDPLMPTLPDTGPASAKNPPAAANPAHTGGAMLRAARQAQGLDIGALAAAIKVPTAKLEALEAGRYHALLDITFTRALAQTVCRVLKIDAKPVLAALPGAPPDALGRVDGGLNTPFRERPGRSAPADWVPWRHPVLWLVAVLLISAAAFVLLPANVVRDVGLLGADAPAVPVMPPAAAASDAGVLGLGLPPAAGGTQAPGLGVPGQVAPADAASAPLSSLQANPVDSAQVAAMPASVNSANGTDSLNLRAVQSTWVQAVDGAGKTLMARTVAAGERIDLTVTPPLRLRIGNVAGTELSFRGKVIDLRSTSRDNTANITLP